MIVSLDGIALTFLNALMSISPKHKLKNDSHLGIIAAIKGQYKKICCLLSYLKISWLHKFGKFCDKK